MVERITAHPLLVFFLSTLDSTNSSNISTTSCRPALSVLALYPPVVSPRLRIRRPALHPDLANEPKPLPRGLQCQNWSTFLPKFRPPTQTKNYATPARP